VERWATFDCYGTLVDWNAGIRSVVGDAVLPRYHELEPQVQAEDPSRSYREVLHEVSAQLGLDDPDELARSLPAWPVFPEVSESLEDTRRRGWKLAILSNTDREFIEASMASIGVPFEFAIVASEIGSYKPAPGHWRAFEERIGRLPDVHVAASHFHDVVPAATLGIPSIWINRLAESFVPPPTRQQPDLVGLADTLGELVA
jgi:2-haloacid dehalogenase